MQARKQIVPTWYGDLYSRRLLENPYAAYRTIRDLGPVVWMPRRKFWAVSRHEDVKAVLRNAEGLVSGRSVAGNLLINRLTAPITLTSDGADHERRRRILRQPMRPDSLKLLRPRLEDEAERLIESVIGGATFDAISSFAAHLPITVIAELVGLNAFGRSRMLRWSAATFDLLGVLNLRAWRAIPHLFGLRRYIANLESRDVEPGSWADRLFEAVARGDLSITEARLAIIDYVAPALDTTILATGHMLWQIATAPAMWEALRKSPNLVPAVVNEAVRLASPIRGFTRYALAPTLIGESTVPAGDRVLVLFASANRDERRYENPDLFDIRRDPRDQVGWGHGAHTCAGLHLARLEMEVILKRLLQRVGRIEADRPVLFYNNVLQGFSHLPARFYAGQ